MEYKYRKVKRLTQLTSTTHSAVMPEVGEQNISKYGC